VLYELASFSLRTITMPEIQSEHIKLNMRNLCISPDFWGKYS